MDKNEIATSLTLSLIEGEHFTFMENSNEGSELSAERLARVVSLLYNTIHDTIRVD